jgi:CrcB protein
MTEATWAFVALGGAIGSVARYGVTVLAARVVPHLVLPYATFAVNVIGCFIIGVLAGQLAQQQLVGSTNMRAFVFVGILGGFTTFSAFALDTLTLTQTGLRATAIANAAGQLVLGLAAVYVGWAIGARS